MTKRQVMRAEKNRSKIVKKKNYKLVYKSNVSGLDCSIIYMFEEGKLGYAEYEFPEDDTTNSCISDYKYFRKLLIKKYGKPDIDGYTWLNENSLYKSHPHYWWIAINLGDLDYMSEWETPRTTIVLSLTGSNNNDNKIYKTKLCIEYMSKKPKNKNKKKKASYDLNNFQKEVR